MKVGLQIIRFDWPNNSSSIRHRLADIARLADETSFASLWVMDHFFQMGGDFGPADAPMLEGYSTIAYLAALTRHVRLGILVTGNPYRHPGLLVKTVSTLDVLSGGRAYLGIGAGWYQREARGLGIPFPNTKERFERLEETLQIAKHMWEGHRTSYLGQYYQLHEPINCPQPLQKPHPPILIGGEGEKKTLRLVAQYGNACNLYAGQDASEYAEGLQTIPHKLMVLQQHCESVGRSYDEIERTVLAGVNITSKSVTVSEVIKLCESLATLGVQHVIFNMSQFYELKPLEILGREIIPIVKEFV
jgi:F420-dependent oxidoreductase-like protein